MRNTIIFTIVLFVAIIVTSIYYFGDLAGKDKETFRPLSFMPAETFAIVTFQNDETTDHIFQDFDIFEAMLGRSQYADWGALKTTFLKHESLSSYVSGVNQYISFHPDGEQIAALFTVPTKEAVDRESLEAFLAAADSAYTLRQQDTLGAHIYHLDKGQPDSVLHIAYEHDIFFATYADSLLYRVLDDKQPKLSEDASDYFVTNNSRNSPLSVYFVHDQLGALSQHLMRRKSGKALQLFEGLGGQSAWNLSFKSDALILTGESETVHKKENYLELFAAQQKSAQTLSGYFPEYTASFLSFAISDRRAFDTGLRALFEARKEASQLDAQFATIKESKNIDFTEDVRPVFAQEFAWVEQSNSTELAFIKLHDTTEFVALRSRLASPTGEGMYRFDHANIPFALYGDPLKSFTRPYFLQLDSVLVLANHLSTLTAYQRDWKNSRLLANTLGFKNSERMQGNEANVTYFSRTSTSSAIIANLLRPAYREHYQDKAAFGYQDFYAWAFQLSGNNGAFQSSIYGVYRSDDALGSRPDWVYAFDNRPITAPQVFEHSDTSQFIFIQEQDHRVHAIHPSGTKLWSSVFHGRIVGETQQLEDRSLVLVTDKNQLYRFDPNGESLPGFSLRMPYRPSYSPTIAQLDGEERILVPAGEHILVYDLAGKLLDNWLDKTVDGDILFGIQVHDNRVYVGTQKGNFYCFDAHGERLKKEHIPDTKFNNPISLVQNDKNRPALYTVDTAQVAYTLDFEAEPQVYQLEWAGPHALLSFFPTTNGSLSKMAISQGAQLWVKELRDSSLSFQYSLSTDLAGRPQFFRQENQGYYIGLATQGTDLLYLLNEQGAVVDGFPVKGMPDFYYGKIDYNSATYLLCARRDRKLYAFKH